MPDPVTVLARAHVARRVERLPAQWAGRPSLQNYLDRAARERAGRVSRDPDPEHGRPVVWDIVRQRLERLLALLLSLDDHALAVVIPRQRDGANPEVLGERQVKRAIVNLGGLLGG